MMARDSRRGRTLHWLLIGALYLVALISGAPSHAESVVWADKSADVPKSYSQSRTIGQKQILFLRCNFPDDLRDPISEAEAQSLMDRVGQFVKENSYAQTSLNVSFTPLLTLPKKASAYSKAATANVLEDARLRATAAGFLPDEYDFYGVFIRPVFPDASGRTTVGSRGTLLQVNNVGLVCHEFGHLFGLWHANAWRSSNDIEKGVNVEYGDLFSTMGNGARELWHFNACEKSALGWLPPGQVQQVQSNGVYRIVPSDNPDLNTGEFRALRLRKDLFREYWMETRQQFGRDPAQSHALLLTWAPWGASDYGTQLLDTHPDTFSFADAPLTPGEAFYDPELGMKVVSAPADNGPEGSLDVLVQSVNQMVIEAEAGQSIADALLESRSDASAGQSLAPGSAGAHVSYRFDVPVTAHYSVWCRMMGSIELPTALEVSVDGQIRARAVPENDPTPGQWRWTRLVGSESGPSALLRTVPLFLQAGSQAVELTAKGGSLRLDCLMLTSDPTTNTAPVLSSISDQVIAAGDVAGPLAFTVLDAQTPSSDLLFDVTSSNTNVIPSTAVYLDGGGINRALTLVSVRDHVGTTTITVTAHDRDANQGSTSFNLCVIGPIQALVNAAKAGDTLVVPAGTYVDQVAINKDLSLEAGPGGEVVIDGGGTGIPLIVGTNTAVTLQRVTVRHGAGNGLINRGRLSMSQCSIVDNRRPKGSDSSGLLNFGVLGMDHCLISGNTASYGAGIQNRGVLQLRYCAVHENIAVTRGGGILNAAPGRATIDATTLSGNQASDGHGAAIYNTGELTLRNVTISGNLALRTDPENDAGTGGGLLNRGRALLLSCTIAGNGAEVAGGGIENHGSLALGNSIVADNLQMDGTLSDLHGSIISHGYNLVRSPDNFTVAGVHEGDLLGVDPLLLPLGDNGGPTWTHALDPHSPAIQAGRSSGLCEDQRGFPRSFFSAGGSDQAHACDIGAFQFFRASVKMPSTIGGVEKSCQLKPCLYVQPLGAGHALELTLTLPELGRRYALQVSMDDIAWETVSTNRDEDFILQWTDETAHTRAHRFYRAELLSDR